jgi:hypothetical protein
MSSTLIVKAQPEYSFIINVIQTSPPTLRNAASNKINIDKITIILPRKIILDRMD